MAFGKSKPAKAVASPPAEEVQGESPADALTKQMEALQKEMEKLQETPAPVAEAPAPKQEPAKKEVTVNDVLVNHEQRIVEMEAKWFRLGGI